MRAAWRCRAPLSRLAKRDDIVAHAYPITPFHADYLGHVDRVPDPKLGTPQDVRLPPLQVRAIGIFAALLGSSVDRSR